MSELLDRWNRCGYYRHANMQVTQADRDGSTFDLDVADEHLQAYGTAHGGVIAGLLDAAMGLAVLGRLPPEDDCTTVELKINFVRPALPGRLTATGRIVNEGRRTFVAWAEAHGSDDALVACGLGTFQRIPGTR